MRVVNLNTALERAMLFEHRVAASAHHCVKLTKKTEQDSWSETGMIGSPEKEREGA